MDNQTFNCFHLEQAIESTAASPPGRGKAFLMPVVRAMSLCRHHFGKEFVLVPAHPDGLDVTASRTADKVFLHVVNTQRSRSVKAILDVTEMRISSGEVLEIAVQPEMEITRFTPRALQPTKKPLPSGDTWEFPPASVSAIELNCEPVKA